jgi:hypothetical protein
MTKITNESRSRPAGSFRPALRSARDESRSATQILFARFVISASRYEDLMSFGISQESPRATILVCEPEVLTGLVLEQGTALEQLASL